MHTLKPTRMDWAPSLSVGPTVFGCCHGSVWLVWAVTGLGVTLGILAFVYGALNYHSLSAVLTGGAPGAAGDVVPAGRRRDRHPPAPQPARVDVPGRTLPSPVTFGYEYASYVFRTAPGTAPEGAGHLGQPVGMGARARVAAHLRAAVVPRRLAAVALAAAGLAVGPPHRGHPRLHGGGAVALAWAGPARPQRA